MLPTSRSNRPRLDRLNNACRLALLASTFSLLAMPSICRADDGIYGRFDGDLAVSLEVGAAIASGDGATAGEAFATQATLSYLHTIAFVAGYQDALGSEARPMGRLAMFGVEIRPLFLGRTAEDLQRGPALLDLVIDSFTLGLGAIVAWPNQHHCSQSAAACSGEGLEVWTGLQLPLLAQAEGPYLAARGGARWLISSPLEPATRGGSTAAIFALSLGYRFQFEAHLVDLGDQLAR